MGKRLKRLPERRDRLQDRTPRCDIGQHALDLGLNERLEVFPMKRPARVRGPEGGGAAGGVERAVTGERTTRASNVSAVSFARNSTAWTAHTSATLR